MLPYYFGSSRRDIDFFAVLVWSFLGEVLIDRT